MFDFLVELPVARKKYQDQSIYIFFKIPIKRPKRMSKNEKVDLFAMKWTCNIRGPLVEFQIMHPKGIGWVMHPKGIG